MQDPRRRECRRRFTCTAGMAVARLRTFSGASATPISASVEETTAVIELLYLYQLARSPVQIMARKVLCRSRHFISRGQHKCPDQ
mgnify:CR=1 FL=1